MAGALARHAEATLERIGAERQGMVREIFRNLVTAQGTRAACDREELLSVFPDRKAAEEVLGQLVAARLLTSYEVRCRGRGRGEATRSRPRAHHRIEIVHESLLRSWLRLVRWQAQDAEGSLLRDQLKQAAHLWDEKGRPADLLWSGTSFREYALWRERYPGKLTARRGGVRAGDDRSRPAAPPAAPRGVRCGPRRCERGGDRRERLAPAGRGVPEARRGQPSGGAREAGAGDRPHPDPGLRAEEPRGARLVRGAAPGARGAVARAGGPSPARPERVGWGASSWRRAPTASGSPAATGVASSRSSRPTGRRPASSRTTATRPESGGCSSPTTLAVSRRSPPATPRRSSGPWRARRSRGSSRADTRAGSRATSCSSCWSRARTGRSGSSSLAGSEVPRSAYWGVSTPGNGWPDLARAGIVYARDRGVFRRPFGSSVSTRADVKVGEHDVPVAGVNVHDGTGWIVSYDERREVRIWDGTTHRRLRTLQGLDPDRLFPCTTPRRPRDLPRVAIAARARLPSLGPRRAAGRRPGAPAQERGHRRRRVGRLPARRTMAGDRARVEGRPLAAAGAVASRHPGRTDAPGWCSRPTPGSSSRAEPANSHLPGDARRARGPSDPVATRDFTCYGLAMDPSGGHVLLAATTRALLLAPLDGGEALPLVRVPPTESITAVALDASGPLGGDGGRVRARCEGPPAARRRPADGRGAGLPVAGG